MELDWWVSFRSPVDIYNKHASFLSVEVYYYFWAFLILIHALRNGGRLVYLWCAALLHGLVVESISYFVPDIDSFWHAQGMVMFLGKRLPLYIVIIYPCFIYTAAVAVSKLHLPRWAEPFAVGLSVVVIDLPYDIIGIKHLHWTWHDTDPNIYDRHYWVPWTSYFFHASFASSFTFLFHGSHRLFSGQPKFMPAGFLCEVSCVLVTGCFAMPLGILQFIPIYHSLHDNFNIHTEVCVFLLVTIYILIVWTGDRNPNPDARSAVNSDKVWWHDEVGFSVLFHFLLYIVRVLLLVPEDIQSAGLHEKIGNCQERVPVHTPFGQVLYKRKYLCVSDFDEGYFDFHCLPEGKAPAAGSYWYTVCGTPYSNHAEYIVIITAVCLFGIYVYRMMLGQSSLGSVAKCKTS